MIPRLIKIFLEKSLTNSRSKTFSKSLYKVKLKEFYATLSWPIISCLSKKSVIIKKAKAEEKTTFDVVLEDIPNDKKVAIYKVVRSIANIAVNQVKDYTATLPKVLKESVSKEEALAAKQQLEEAGAKVKIA